ncbi:hypothetical protein Acr_25g0008320 [Actinidia rufa]|uniref:Retrovirus-related Pol polyprotein from transposon TNT 1-94-like beta-barrel domain-containing protein n=1 Tax=Actinidia rufa TaxID=165716 RepID=A0A7J0H016_9ERIC|nr:hypothetical protein Acr_25g0008320 [Actinidia rufa]
MAVDNDESDVLLAASEDGKSDWVLDSGSAYHLCRDREVFSTYAACEGRVWMANNTASRVVSKGSVRFRMADGRSVTLTEVKHGPDIRKNLISIGMLDSKGCRFEASGGTLSVSKGNKEMLWGRKTEGLYRLEGSVQTGGATVRHGSSGISEKSGQGKQPLHRGKQAKQAQGYLEDPEWYKSAWRCFGICTEVWPNKSDATSAGLAVISPVVCTREERWSHDNSQSESYGGAGSEAVRKDNLKTSDYPPVGWRGRLLSPAHLDESKPIWKSPSPVAKPKPVWSSYGVSM